ncbi:MAG: hypothetical protein ABI559_10210 [Chloroflexota bacterium]
MNLESPWLKRGALVLLFLGAILFMPVAMDRGGITPYVAMGGLFAAWLAMTVWAYSPRA